MLKRRLLARLDQKKALLDTLRPFLASSVGRLQEQLMVWYTTPQALEA